MVAITNSVIKEQQEVKQLVEELLMSDVRTRNNDLWLVLQVWAKKQHIKLYVAPEDIGTMITPETITRVRRAIQNTEHRLLPTDPSVIVKRGIKYDTLKAYYSHNPELLESIKNRIYGVK